jgi:hypothetical protein
MHTKPHTVLKLDSERNDLNILVTPVLVVCEDGSAYTYSVGGRWEWSPLPPIPGTHAAAQAEVAR